MHYIYNTFHIGQNDVHDGMTEFINTSARLDSLAEKLNSNTLENIADATIARDSHNKTRFSDLITGLNTLYFLMKKSNNKPIFLMQNHWDTSQATGFYFFIGTHSELEDKLAKLLEEEQTRKDYSF